MKFITQAAKVLNEQKKYKRRLAVFLCLAVVVALGTAAALKMYGQAMSHKQKKLVCRYAAHAHTDGCFDGEAVVCGYADYAVHLHNDDCYGPNGDLVCHLQEAEAHVHTEECYTQQEVLICEEEGAQAHEHTEGCYIPERGELLCQTEEHMHEDSCYGENGEIICPLEEHQHDDNCYEWKDVLTCTLGGHTHTEDCYTREMRDLSCNLEEHEHGEACYDENGELVCQLEEHTHEDNCYVWEDVLTCQLEESDGGHVHGDGCYEMQKVLSCGKLELHTHDDSCYDGNGALTCGLLQLEEHVHGEDCFETVELTEEEIIALSGAGEESVSGDAVSGDSVSGDSVSADDAKEAHEHTDECYDAAGGLMCGYYDVTEEEPDIVKTCKKDSYIVTARYSKNAGIPEEAELEAELVTAESGGEHYEQREAQIREALEDDSVSMNSLLRVGFYVDEEEVEPKDDVLITLQYLDKNGFKDGNPIAVVHFAEGGSEVISGGKAKDGSTTFKTGSFSEFGIVEGYEVLEEDQKDQENNEEQIEEEILTVSETCEYENDMFHALFRIKGEVKVSSDLADSIESAEQEEEADQQNESGSGVSVNVTDNEAVLSDENMSSIEDEPAEESVEEETLSADEISEYDNSTDSIASDDTDSISVNKEDVSQADGLKFEVEPINKNAEEYVEDYDAVAACMDETGSDEGRLMLQLMSYSLTYENIKLDMSDCEVTVEITPSASLRKKSSETAGKTPDGEEMHNEITLSVIQPLTQTEEDMTVSVETDTDEDVTATSGTGEDLSGDKKEKTGRLMDAALVKNLEAPMVVALTTTGTEGSAAVSVDSQANPKFSVEFYAEIDRFATGPLEDEKAITVIDTSGKKMPINGGNMPKKKIYLRSDNTVLKRTELTEIYSKSNHEYILAPGLVYFNKIAKNDNYKLKEIKVQRKGTTDWENYACKDAAGKEKEWHFTNKEDTQKEYPNDFILITADATIRLVHEVKKVSQSNGAFFYDYDVSDGKIYKSDDITGGTFNRNETTHESGDSWYMYTKRQGINSNLPDQTFGFGNSEGLLKTTMGGIVGNMANAQNAAYGSPTFGLVTGLVNGKIQYAPNVKAPNLFNDGDAKGKENYAGNLIFRQEGDTYTLTGAEVMENGEIVSSKTDADKFTRQRDNWNETYYFAGNDFYPMDGVSSAGRDGHDLQFGSLNSTKVINNFSGKNNTLPMPKSDDEQNHNHYFGMHYTIEFDLSKDYIGPLEYLFYGDDDMWVFLDGDGYNGKLICDIGGVHSSVGEYVNLWDYIQKGTEGHYKLSFFYTERGASGSTCWMQFTIPSVSFATTEQDTGKLKVEKKITGAENEDQEFGFNIKFKDQNGKELRDDYSYTKYDSETGNVIDRDILIWNDSKFTLKAGQYIEINFLPVGAVYTIEEVGPVEVTKKEPSIGLEWNVSSNNPYKPEITGGTQTDTVGKITGEITNTDLVQIIYNNVQKFELPETGGIGINLYMIAGVLCIMFGTYLIYRKAILAKRV